MMAGINHAIGGTKRRNCTTGSQKARTNGNNPIPSPSGMPTMQPRLNPMAMRRKLTPMSASSAPLRISSTSELKIALGIGNSGELSIRLAKAQSPITASTESVVSKGRVRRDDATDAAPRARIGRCIHRFWRCVEPGVFSYDIGANDGVT